MGFTRCNGFEADGGRETSMRSLILILSATLLLPACSREEEPVANRFERQQAEIENKARAYEAQVENEVSAVETRLEKETDALLQNQAGLNETAANEAEAESNRR